MEEVFDFCVYDSDQLSPEPAKVSMEKDKEEGELSSDEEQPTPTEQQSNRKSEQGPLSNTPFLPLSLECAPISWTRSYLMMDFFNQKGNSAPFEIPDFTQPPPTAPNFYGSTLFPQVELYGGCPSQVLANISNKFCKSERDAYEATRARPFYDLHNSRRGRRSFCTVCSEYKVDPKPIWHRHESSKMHRLSATADPYGRYECHQCEIRDHYFIPGGRTSLIITSSTLNDFWGTKSGVPYVGDSLHLDQISVPGGRLLDLRRAFLAEYSGHPLPIDVLVVAGYNDVLNSGLDWNPIGLEHHLVELERVKEAAAVKLEEEARALMRAVLDAHIPHQTNSIAFATLPVIPRLGWMDRSDSARARGVNIIRGQQISLLNRYNDTIKVLNTECKEQTGIDTVRAPSFRSWGLQRRPNAEPGPRGPFTYRLAHFRESRPEEMLHFSAYTKLKMGRAAGRYFKALYDLAENVGDSKAEAVARRAALRSLRQAGGREEMQSERRIFWDPSYDRCDPKDL